MHEKEISALWLIGKLINAGGGPQQSPRPLFNKSWVVFPPDRAKSRKPQAWGLSFLIALKFDGAAEAPVKFQCVQIILTLEFHGFEMSPWKGIAKMNVESL